MITEDYVSFETAKLLKEKGFDEECDCLYDNDAPGTPGLEIDRDIRCINSYLDDSQYAAPTLQMAMKWLRKKHILIVLDVENFCAASWIYHIWCDDNIEESHSDSFKTYEEACEAAIKYCLENLI